TGGIMRLIRRAVTAHGGRIFYVLIPVSVDSNIAAGYDQKGYVIIWGNGSGYQFLAECFSIAAELKENEILYIPSIFKPGAAFKELFSNCEHGLDIVCVNYCELQISPKDIDKLMRINVYTEQVTTRTPTINNDFIERWKTDRRPTVKLSKQNLCITTNRDGYRSLACGADSLSQYGDDFDDDGFLPHVHYDWSENTSVSVGVNLYHWSNR
ncbi:MAG: hypothetical protein AAGU75_24020, partial [Bacillota bacterium]